MLSVGDAIPVGAERAAGGHNRSSVREGVDIAEKVPDVWIVRESRFVDYADPFLLQPLGCCTEIYSSPLIGVERGFGEKPFYPTRSQDGHEVHAGHTGQGLDPVDYVNRPLCAEGFEIFLIECTGFPKLSKNVPSFITSCSQTCEKKPEAERFGRTWDGDSYEYGCPGQTSSVRFFPPRFESVPGKGRLRDDGLGSRFDFLSQAVDALLYGMDEWVFDRPDWNVRGDLPSLAEFSNEIEATEGVCR